MKKIIKKIASKSPFIKRAYYAYRRSNYIFPDYPKRLENSNNEVILKRKKVLISTSVGGLPTAVNLDSLLGLALSERNAEVHYLLCDNFLPGCLMTEAGILSPKDMIKNGPKKHFCKNCLKDGLLHLNKTGLKIHKFSEYVSKDQVNDLLKESELIYKMDYKNLDADQKAIYEHAKAGCLRYFASSIIEEDTKSQAILKKFIHSALISKTVIENLMKDKGFDVISLINGIYIPQGIISYFGKKSGARIVTWNVAYRKKSFIFSHDDTYHHTLMHEPQTDWKNFDFSSFDEAEIEKYLDSRQRGGRDWIMFQSDKPIESSEGIISSLKGLDKAKPIIGMLTNVAWDAQLHYPANAFKNMLEWVVSTIQYFEQRQDLQLVIRIHPAEISGDIPSRQPVVKEIRKHFPKIPKNVFVISPQSDISTYKLMDLCNAAIIYGTKTGVELASVGMPVIVAGEAWIRNKGLTHDADSESSYKQILDMLPFKSSMTKEQITLAKKYAYHFFFRRMIPLDIVEATGGEPQFVPKIDSFLQLREGKSKGLDIICNGILEGSPFIYPSEKYGIFDSER